MFVSDSKNDRTQNSPNFLEICKKRSIPTEIDDSARAEIEAISTALAKKQVDDAKQDAVDSKRQSSFSNGVSLSVAIITLLMWLFPSFNLVQLIKTISEFFSKQ